MQSAIQTKLYNSVKVIWLNKKVLIKNLKEAVKNLVRSRPEVLQVILFGSVAEGRALPSSDVDILIIISKVNTHFLNRPLVYYEYFRNVGLGTDIFVYTEAELTANTIPLVQTALKRGKPLYNAR